MPPGEIETWIKHRYCGRTEQQAGCVERASAGADRAHGSSAAAAAEWDDLKTDLTPVAMDLFPGRLEQLNEIEPYVQLEDLLYLVKRLARNTPNIEQLLDQGNI